MPRPNFWVYEKQRPFRDATFFVIICEGEKREPQYFQFFDGISSRIKVISIPSSEGKTSPKHLLNNALKIDEKMNLLDEDQIWFVLDTDRWIEAIHELRNESKKKPNWFVAQSNPCFEVWLYYHFESAYPINCDSIKQQIHELVNGGFDCTKHPSLIKTAYENSKSNYRAKGYWPETGSSQVYLLAEKIIPLIEDQLKEIDLLRKVKK